MIELSADSDRLLRVHTNFSISILLVQKLALHGLEGLQESDTEICDLENRKVPSYCDFVACVRRRPL